MDRGAELRPETRQEAPPPPPSRGQALDSAKGPAFGGVQRQSLWLVTGRSPIGTKLSGQADGSSSWPGLSRPPVAAPCRHGWPGQALPDAHILFRNRLQMSRRTIRRVVLESNWESSEVSDAEER